VVAVSKSRGVPRHVSADRTNYVVSEGEFPTYMISGAAPDPVLWSLWRDHVKVVEDQSFGVTTNSGGQWSVEGPRGRSVKRDSGRSSQTRETDRP
jgi:hypothetical protein